MSGRSARQEVNNGNNATNSLILNHLLVHFVVNKDEQWEQPRRDMAGLFR